MNIATAIELPVAEQRTTAHKAAVAVLFAVLLFRAVQFAVSAIAAVRYPWELDYGEGIVWQQALFIFTHKAYGPIDHFPAIVFHYTPIYHAVTDLLARGLGTDELATGRAVSLLSTVVAALVAGVIAAVIVKRGASRNERRLTGCAAALTVFTFVPVAIWAPLMRVDMLALAFAMVGLAAAMKAAERPRLIFVAALCFVAAVYTKQIAIAAPVAAFAILLFTRPKTAFQGIAACVALGSVLLAGLTWATDGGFFRHVFLYNVNRIDLARLWWMVLAVAQHAVFVALAGWVVVRRILDFRSRFPSVASLRSAAPAEVREMIALAYFAVTTAMLLTVVKSGSSINYFVEWCYAIAIFVAVGLQELSLSLTATVAGRRPFAILLPLGLALQAAITLGSPFDTNIHGRRARELAVLSRQVAAAPKPVISDDMVLLLRSGREVLWEPAIFAELASTGAWDERPFVQRIRNHEFAFFVTSGKRGEPRFDERYRPAVAEAMDEAYPVKSSLGGLIIHRPRDAKAAR